MAKSILNRGSLKLIPPVVTSKTTFRISKTFVFRKKKQYYIRVFNLNVADEIKSIKITELYLTCLLQPLVSQSAVLSSLTNITHK